MREIAVCNIIVAAMVAIVFGVSASIAQEVAPDGARKPVVVDVQFDRSASIARNRGMPVKASVDWVLERVAPELAAALKPGDTLGLGTFADRGPEQRVSVQVTDPAADSTKAMADFRKLVPRFDGQWTLFGPVIAYHQKRALELEAEGLFLATVIVSDGESSMNPKDAGSRGPDDSVLNLAARPAKAAAGAILFLIPVPREPQFNLIAGPGGRSAPYPSLAAALDSLVPVPLPETATDPLNAYGPELPAGVGELETGTEASSSILFDPAVGASAAVLAVALLLAGRFFLYPFLRRRKGGRQAMARPYPPTHARPIVAVAPVVGEMVVTSAVAAKGSHPGSDRSPEPEKFPLSVGRPIIVTTEEGQQKPNGTGLVVVLRPVKQTSGRQATLEVTVGPDHKVQLINRSIESAVDLTNPRFRTPKQVRPGARISRVSNGDRFQFPPGLADFTVEFRIHGRAVSSAFTAEFQTKAGSDSRMREGC